jgi:hypothetical protein
VTYKYEAAALDKVIMCPINASLNLNLEIHSSYKNGILKE